MRTSLLIRRKLCWYGTPMKPLEDIYLKLSKADSCILISDIRYEGEPDSVLHHRVITRNATVSDLFRSVERALADAVIPSYHISEQTADRLLLTLASNVHNRIVKARAEASKNLDTELENILSEPGNKTDNNTDNTSTTKDNT